MWDLNIIDRVGSISLLNPHPKTPLTITGMNFALSTMLSEGGARSTSQNVSPSSVSSNNLQTSGQASIVSTMAGINSVSPSVRQSTTLEPTETTTLGFASVPSSLFARFTGSSTSTIGLQPKISTISAVKSTALLTFVGSGIVSLKLLPGTTALQTAAIATFASALSSLFSSYIDSSVSAVLMPSTSNSLHISTGTSTILLPRSSPSALGRSGTYAHCGSAAASSTPAGSIEDGNTVAESSVTAAKPILGTVTYFVTSNTSSTSACVSSTSTSNCRVYSNCRRGN